MSGETEELIRICEALPDVKRNEVVDFARFLLARQEGDAWERTISENKRRPRLEAFLKESAAEGDVPLDPTRL